jgi:predicted phosphodiesterase
MRLAVLSDIHSNLQGLQKSLEIVSQKNVDAVVCLGDLIGYGANPNECIELVRKTTEHILLGNHDEAAIELSKTEYFNPLARTAAEWTSKELTKEHVEFIQRLPFTLELDGSLFVHSSPYEPAEWHYILSPADAQFNFYYFTQPVCFLGHSHVPAIYCDDGRSREFLPGKKFIINVGSVGQPRDNDWRLSLGIFDTEAGTYENIRSEYDVEEAAERIRNAGLPRPLADRLLVGR